MPSISLSNQTYNYTIERQKRKTLQLKLISTNRLQIKAPKSMPLKEITNFIHQKEAWIKQKNALLQHADTTVELFNSTVTDGATLLFRGKKLTLTITISMKKPAIHIIADTLLINLYGNHPMPIDTFLKQWYIKQAALILEERTKFWCKELEVTVNRIMIKDQKTRWGSCSSLGNINYNWRIVMAPDATINYLVIHELAHRTFLDHSKNFWYLVETHCPDYIAQRLWLKQNGHILTRIL
jgi:predicted metal-dependent hydrolase